MRRRRFLKAAFASGLAFSALPYLSAGSAGTVDVQLIGDILRSLHPGLGRYLAPREFEFRLQKLDQAWRQQPSIEQRFLSLTEFLARIRCGH